MGPGGRTSIREENLNTILHSHVYTSIKGGKSEYNIVHVYITTEIMKFVDLLSTPKST